MNILIANIGTSDLAVQIKVDEKIYCLPIDYLPSEANLEQKIAQLPDNLKPFWHYKTQRSYIETILYQDLGFAAGNTQSSREVTKVLWEKYEEFPTKWHDRIKPVRIWGVIKKAMELGAERGYIFVTDQVTKQRPNGHEKDTVYLYKILNKWLEIEKGKNPELQFEIKDKIVEPKIDANKLEPLLSYYEKAIGEIAEETGLKITSSESENKIVFFSIKGGTDKMLTALQFQAIDSGFKTIIFIEPELDLEKILQGGYSECKLTFYWRYIRSQKYRTVQQLLSRWDFDGAILVLKDWQKTIESLPNGVVNSDELNTHKQAVKLVNVALDVGLHFFNLDCAGVDKIFKELNNELNLTRADAEKVLNENVSLSSLKLLNPNYQPWLNLYTQCRIYAALNEAANLLARLSSFWEEVLNDLIDKLGCHKYFVGNINDWNLDKKLIEPKLWEIFYNKEKAKNTKFKTWNFDNNYYKLSQRFSKLCLLECVIIFQGKDQETWKKFKKNLIKLNYWVEQRNNLIHRTAGVSIDRKEADKIIDLMTEVGRLYYKLLSQDSSPFLGKEAPHYLYSEIRDWVFDKLRE